ncbi:Lrp/AsnC family transcriptional regulator [Lysinibacter sp. HNR]|uniref:Lrp/AsnC family transcriptional regulator n=1 Tax=Lysinibacter sp. HNR TaxID=3031408 RepID=UPI002435CB72|nr:Lrp/AsnC family transcriptional regulator [Lysinibacter sp. HNR]WGD37137.1 Lrp/AsnC family transcriptional regulator [Lysinibacter sp. HNR]
MSNKFRNGAELDKIDMSIVGLLQGNGRMSNNELAQKVGIAASTCISRVRSLIDRGVIMGFSAQVDPARFGLTLQVLVSVTIRSGARQRIAEFSQELRELPEVLQVFFLGGVEDFIVHLAVRDADHVREFVVENLSAHPAVATTRTSMVFEHHANRLGNQAVEL